MEVSSLFLKDPEAAGAIRRQQMAAQLMAQAQPQGPIRSPMGVYGSLAQSLVAALMARSADQDIAGIGARRKADSARQMQEIIGAMGGGGGAQGMAQAAPQGQDAMPMGGDTAPMPQAPQPQASAMPGGAGGVPPDLLPHYQAAAARNNIPLPLLLAQAQQESGFRTNAAGGAGEVGLGQIKPSTARAPGFGVQPVDPATLASNPAANINFQADYLAGRGRAAGVTDWNDPAQADRGLAAYNGGGDPQYAQHVRARLPAFLGLGTGAPAAGQPPVASGGGGGMPAPQGQAGAQAGAGGDSTRMRRLAIQAAMSDDPDVQRLAPILAQFAAKDAPRPPVSVSPGSSLVDPATGRPIYTAPKDPTAEPLERVVGPDGNPVLRPRSQAAGQQPYVPEARPPALMPPEVEDQQSRLRAAGKPDTRIDMRAETSEAQGRGKSLAEEGERIRLGGEAAASMLDTVRHVRALGVDTGRLAGAQEAIGGWLDALGVKGADIIRKARSLQEFNAAASNFVLGKQLEQKGVQSESDAKRMRETFASITNVTEANDAILRATEAQSRRAMDRAAFYQDWRSQHNGSVDGANEAWTGFIRDTPLVAKSRDGQLMYFNEYMPHALEMFGGDQNKALQMWRERAK